MRWVTKNSIHLLLLPLPICQILGPIVVHQSLSPPTPALDTTHCSLQFIQVEIFVFFFSFHDLRRSDICSECLRACVNFLCPCSGLAHLPAQVSGAEHRGTRWQAAGRRAGRRRHMLPLPCRCGSGDQRERRRQGSSAGGPETQGVSGPPRHSGSLSYGLNMADGETERL